MRVLIAVVFVCVVGIVVAAYIATDSRPYKDGLVAYYDGDHATALRLWRPMAEQGYPGAQNNLGVMYRDGQGVPEDRVQAYMWFSLAASRFPPGEAHDRVAQRRDALAELMPWPQITEAERLALKWKPRAEPVE
jgi:TPR repeat protein